jgi:PTS system fructose-specific IIC component
MLFHVGSQAPHGGIFVAFAISPLWGFAVALLAGTVVTAVLVSLLKKKPVA